ncbi:hypothetical protein KEM52_001790 [Ascosphaera acerosa]|nr:hypothetical protein KEM52_001790 [Ascosphaera acerosa]
MSGFAVGFFVIGNIEPFHQHFSLENKSLQYPYAVDERVPIWLAATISVGVPVVVIAVYTFFLDGLFSHSKHEARPGAIGRYTVTQRLWQFNCGILGLLLSQSSAFIITNALKNACGKPRPDVIDRCQPKRGSQDMPVYGLSNYTICTQTDKSILDDGFRSWPSGHSSSSFAGLFFLSLYLAGKIHLMDNRGEVWKTIIAAAPTVGAALIAVSRIMDARHHPFDVITGSLLGVLCAWVAYRQYFPPLSDYAAKGRAYPIRSWGSTPMSPSSSAESRAARIASDEMKLVTTYSESTPMTAAETANEENIGMLRHRLPSESSPDSASSDPAAATAAAAAALGAAPRYAGPPSRYPTTTTTYGSPTMARQDSMSQYSGGPRYAGGSPNEYEMQVGQGSSPGGIGRNNTVTSTISAPGPAGGRELVGTTYNPYGTVPEEEELRPVSRDIPTHPQAGY